MNRKLYIILPLMCLLSLVAMGQGEDGEVLNLTTESAVVGKVKQKTLKVREKGAAKESLQEQAASMKEVASDEIISDLEVASQSELFTVSKSDTTSENRQRGGWRKGRKSKTAAQDTTSVKAEMSNELPQKSATQSAAESSKSKAPVKGEQKEDVGTLNAEWERYKIEHHLGVKGGYGMGSGRFEPGMENVTHLGLYDFGLVYMFDVPRQKYVGTIQIELEYLEKGYSYLTYRQSKEAYSRDYAVIQLPILWQPYLPLSRKNTNSRFFINAGPFVNYIVNFNSTYRKYNVETNATIEQGNYTWNVMRDNRFEYGIAAGAGFRIGIKRFSLTIEYRYNITLSDVMKGVDKYKGNPFFRSPIDQMNISLGLNVKL